MARRRRENFALLDTFLERFPFRNRLLEDKKAQNLQSQLNVLNTILNKIKSSHDLPSEYRNIFVTIVDEETNKISTNLANIQIKVNEALVSYEKAKNETKDAVTKTISPTHRV